MARPSKYSPEFRIDAVALWRASGGKRTVRDVAADLNVNTETLRSWIYAAELHSKLFATVGQARLELFRWLTFYSARRRHSALFYLSPLEFEQQHQKVAELPLAA